MSGASGSREVKVLIDGQELTGCRAVEVRAAFDEMVTATFDVIVTDQLSVDVDAHVTLVLTVMPGYELEEVVTADGGRRVRAVAKA